MDLIVDDDIAKFVSETFLVRFGLDATPHTDLFEAGLIDSFGFIELVSFLERTYAITLTDHDLNSPRIATLDGIRGIVRERRQALDG